MTELFFNRLTKIDKAIEKGPMDCDFSKEIDQYLLEDASRNHFYTSLEDPGWIDILDRAGKFSKIPEPHKDTKGEAIIIPPWPESRYLVKMAPLVPEKVLRILLSIPKTENERVYFDIIDAALAMPADLAAKLVPKAKILLESKYKTIFPDQIGALMAHLARGGQVEEALDLARTLLKILPPDEKTEVSKEEEEFILPPEPKARFDSWFYEEILKKYMPDLVNAGEERALTLLCELLEDAIRLSGDLTNEDVSKDKSFIWRPAIEDHAQNYPHGLEQLLVSAVRDAAETLIQKNGTSILKTIESRPLKVFQRIGLHLRRKWPDIDPEGTAAIMSNPETFDDIYLHHEFFHLLQKQFGNLQPEAQQPYLDFVSRGIDVEEWFKMREEETGQRPEAEEGERYARSRKYSRLWPIRDFLDKKWQEQFNALKDEFDELEHPDFNIYTTTRVIETTSPKAVEELNEMNIDQIISYLKDWKPSKTPLGPSREGLGRELTNLVISDPSRFAEESMKFQQVHLTYVRALISGFRQAVKQNKAFSWDQVLVLCKWVVDQPRKISKREDGFPMARADFGFARQEIAHLLSVGFQSENAGIPYKFRDISWKVLSPITEDPDPTPEYEKEYGGSNMDPSMLSINTARGEAIHSVVRYALWVRHHIEKEQDGKERIKKGFDEMPEVRNILNIHLEPEQDPSPAIRAVYGQWYPWLAKIDKNWAAEEASKIFPKEEHLKDFRDAAWVSFIAFCAPYDSVFELLKEEYEHAIDKIGTIPPDKRYPANPDERLAEHLMAFYWRGKLSLDKPDELLERFYSKSPDHLCAHALDFVGRSLHKTEEEVSPEILDRLQRLWEHRFKTIKNDKIPDSHTAELSAFGWWFASGKFDDNWSIKQLEEILEITGQIGREHWVFDRLEVLAPKLPNSVVKCLRIIIEGEEEDLHIYSRENQIRIILTAVIKSGDGSAKETAKQLIHQLGTRGFLKFRDLLFLRELQENNNSH